MLQAQIPRCRVVRGVGAALGPPGNDGSEGDLLVGVITSVISVNSGTGWVGAAGLL